MHFKVFKIKRCRQPNIFKDIYTCIQFYFVYLKTKWTISCLNFSLHTWNKREEGELQCKYKYILGKIKRTSDISWRTCIFKFSVEFGKKPTLSLINSSRCSQVANLQLEKDRTWIMDERRFYCLCGNYILTNRNSENISCSEKNIYDNLRKLSGINLLFKNI